MSSFVGPFSLNVLLQIWLLVLSVISVNGFSVGTPVEKLKQCSNFDYEEKLLEKVVRLEHSIELERKLKHFEDMLSEKVIKMENANNEKMKEIENHMNAKLKRLDEEDVKRRDSFQSQMDKLDEELHHQKNESAEELSRQRDEFAEELSRQKMELAKELNRQKNESNELIQNLTINSEDLTNNFIDEHNSLLKATRRETEKQKQALADVMNDLKLNSSSLNANLVDQQKKNNEKILSFIQTESSNNKVSLTTCAQYNKYNGGSAILFSSVHTRNGISSQVISSLKSTGIFTCEKPGLYLISIYMSTNTHESYIILYKNSAVKAYIYYSFNGYHQTNSATVLEYLAIGDTVTVQPGGTMYIYSDQQSCLSLLQLTN